MNEIAIKIQGIGKKYSLGKQKDDSLRTALSTTFKVLSKKKEDFWALKDVSFEINKGDVVGIIGKNGAGKSTLLKILSQITKPTEGRIEINGRVSSLLEVGTGFHPELTGRENIYLNGTILGMTRREVKAKFDEIVDFSGVEKFIDTPVKHYSSGMYVRLAFAVAAHLDPEILIIDEVLAVGDAEFQEKCLGKMKDVAVKGRTVLFVSHNMAIIKSLCNKGILLKNGNVYFNGTIEGAVQKYKSFRTKYLSSIEIEAGEFDLTKHPNKKEKNGSGMLRVLTYCDNIKQNVIYPSRNFKFVIEITNLEKYDNVLYGFVIKNSNGEPLIGINNRHTGHKFFIDKGEKKELITEIPNFPIFKKGSYSVDLYWGNHNTSYEIIEDAFSFDIDTYDVYETKNLLDSKLNIIYTPKVIIDMN